MTNIRVLDERGDEHFEYRPQNVSERPYRRKVQLPLGRITFQAETEGGGKAQLEFEMTSLSADQPPVVLHAK